MYSAPTYLLYSYKYFGGQVRVRVRRCTIPSTPITSVRPYLSVAEAKQVLVSAHLFLTTGVAQSNIGCLPTSTFQEPDWLSQISRNRTDIALGNEDGPQFHFRTGSEETLGWWREKPPGNRRREGLPRAWPKSVAFGARFCFDLFYHPICRCLLTRSSQSVSRALREECNIRHKAFAMVYLDNHGRTKFEASSAIQPFLDDIFLPDVCQRFVQAVDGRTLGRRSVQSGQQSSMSTT